MVGLVLRDAALDGLCLKLFGAFPRCSGQAFNLRAGDIGAWGLTHRFLPTANRLARSGAENPVDTTRIEIKNGQVPLNLAPFITVQTKRFFGAPLFVERFGFYRLEPLFRRRGKGPFGKAIEISLVTLSIVQTLGGFPSGDIGIRVNLGFGRGDGGYDLGLAQQDKIARNIAGNIKPVIIGRRQDRRIGVG